MNFNSDQSSLIIRIETLAKFYKLPQFKALRILRKSNRSQLVVIV